MLFLGPRESRSQKLKTTLRILKLLSFTYWRILETYTVRPRDTRPQAARTLQMHVFELGPKKIEMNEFM